MDRMIFSESFLVSLRKGISNVEHQTPPCTGDITVTPNDILATEVIHPNDERNNSKMFDKAKKNDISGLNRRNTWSIVNAQEVPRDANVIGGRFANVLKNVGTEKEFGKARYVAQGYSHKMKPFVVRNTPTHLQTSI